MIMKNAKKPSSLPGIQNILIEVLFDGQVYFLDSKWL